MSDHLDSRTTRLPPGPVADCQRFRVEVRVVDSETQKVERNDYREGSVMGSIFFAFKTNVLLDDTERRALVDAISDLLIEARHANGDEA